MAEPEPFSLWWCVKHLPLLLGWSVVRIFHRPKKREKKAVTVEEYTVIRVPVNRVLH